MSVGKRIREMRELRALSQRDLATLSGVAPNSISAIERGERFTYPSTRRKLAGALGVEPEDLIDAGDYTMVHADYLADLEEDRAALLEAVKRLKYEFKEAADFHTDADREVVEYAERVIGRAEGRG